MIFSTEKLHEIEENEGGMRWVRPLDLKMVFSQSGSDIRNEIWKRLIREEHISKVRFFFLVTEHFVH